MSDICAQCAYDAEDEETGGRVCLVNMDEDEVYRFLSGAGDACPYFRLDNEYGVVRRQN